MGRPAILLPPEAEAIVADGAASGATILAISERLAAVGVRVSSGTVHRKLVALRGRVRSSKSVRLERAAAPKKVHECLSCHAPIGGTGATGLCWGCIVKARAEANAPEGTVWLDLPNGKRRRASTCHPELPAVSGESCYACYAKTKPPQWRSEEALARKAAKKALALRERAAREGRVVRSRTPPVAHPCKAEGCEVMVAGKAYCSPECRPAKKARAGCSVCGAPTVGQRKTCSDPCFVESAVRRRALVVGQLTSHGQPIVRSESYRAKRRKERAVKYRRPDKAAVIARLTAEQDGKCKVCGCDGGAATGAVSREPCSAVDATRHLG